ncbi:unnamed protein product [Prorocentrum cordatum]|uniref:Uncharacterized protein n=1 Tax=Prorocentrum cordatum TaxID=2364126 RepID=A0ABN9VQZ5_9DINO|nr:unnamed protein product [Polarella glacialis]
MLPASSFPHLPLAQAAWLEHFAFRSLLASGLEAAMAPPFKQCAMWACGLVCGLSLGRGIWWHFLAAQAPRGVFAPEVSARRAEPAVEAAGALPRGTFAGGPLRAPAALAAAASLSVVAALARRRPQCRARGGEQTSASAPERMEALRLSGSWPPAARGASPAEARRGLRGEDLPAEQEAMAWAEYEARQSNAWAWSAEAAAQGPPRSAPASGGEDRAGEDAPPRRSLVPVLAGPRAVQVAAAPDGPTPAWRPRALLSECAPGVERGQFAMSHALPAGPELLEPEIVLPRRGGLGRAAEAEVLEAEVVTPPLTPTAAGAAAAEAFGAAAVQAMRAAADLPRWLAAEVAPRGAAAVEAAATAAHVAADLPGRLAAEAVAHGAAAQQAAATAVQTLVADAEAHGAAAQQAAATAVRAATEIPARLAASAEAHSAARHAGATAVLSAAEIPGRLAATTASAREAVAGESPDAAAHAPRVHGGSPERRALATEGAVRDVDWGAVAKEVAVHAVHSARDLPAWLEKQHELRREAHRQKLQAEAEAEAEAETGAGAAPRLADRDQPFASDADLRATLQRAEEARERLTARVAEGAARRARAAAADAERLREVRGIRDSWAAHRKDLSV